MVRRIIGKNIITKHIRQFSQKKDNNADNTAIVKEEKTVKENKEKKEKDMADERLKKIEAIVGEKAPKRKVKVEKKDKGLFERTENSVTVLTEDNKMLLND